MTKNQLYRDRLARAFGLFVVMASCIAVINPEVRSAVRSKLQPEFRVVLSSATVDLLKTGQLFTIVKLKTHEGLFVEIYEDQGKSAKRLKSRIELGHSKDAYFNFNGLSTNLAIDDVDGDNQLDILAPSFDSSLVAHVNLIKYNSASGEFTQKSSSTEELD